MSDAAASGAGGIRQKKSSKEVTGDENRSGGQRAHSAALQ